jgi:hypothetical protein
VEKEEGETDSCSCSFFSCMNPMVLVTKGHTRRLGGILEQPTSYDGGWKAKDAGCKCGGKEKTIFGQRAGRDLIYDWAAASELVAEDSSKKRGRGRRERNLTGKVQRGNCSCVLQCEV